jgi:hypothetical protein
MAVFMFRCVLYCSAAYIQEVLTVWRFRRFGEMYQTPNYGVIYNLVTLHSYTLDYPVSWYSFSKVICIFILSTQRFDTVVVDCIQYFI